LAILALVWHEKAGQIRFVPEMRNQKGSRRTFRPCGKIYVKVLKAGTLPVVNSPVDV
jgi:hypothetical protein